jgi:hypothetical protein
VEVAHTMVCQLVKGIDGSLEMSGLALYQNTSSLLTIRENAVLGSPASCYRMRSIGQVWSKRCGLCEGCRVASGPDRQAVAKTPKLKSKFSREASAVADWPSVRHVWFEFNANAPKLFNCFL